MNYNFLFPVHTFCVSYCHRYLFLMAIRSWIYRFADASLEKMRAIMK